MLHFLPQENVIRKTLLVRSYSILTTEFEPMRIVCACSRGAHEFIQMGYMYEHIWLKFTFNIKSRGEIMFKTGVEKNKNAPHPFTTYITIILPITAHGFKL